MEKYNLKYHYFSLIQKKPLVPLALLPTLYTIERRMPLINSKEHSLKSDEVLKILRPDLIELGYKVESGKKHRQQVRLASGDEGSENCTEVPVDAFHESYRILLEAEAGQAMYNNNIHRNLLNGITISQVEHVIVLVCLRYRKSNDYDRASKRYKTLFSTQGLILPLHGVLLIGY